jgi:DNA-binding MarR family transcriptional regulator
MITVNNRAVEIQGIIQDLETKLKSLKREYNYLVGNRKRRLPITHEMRCKVIDLHNSTNLSYRAIGDRLGVSKSTVGAIVKTYKEKGLCSD